MRKLIWSLFAVSLLMGGCAVSPSHPALRTSGSIAAPSERALPPLLPVRSFVADLDATGAYQVSPDGRQLMWSGRIGLGPGIFVKDVQSGQVRSFAFRGVGVWAQDSRHVLLHTDWQGDENTHVLALDTAAPGLSIKDLTPFGRSKSHLHSRLPGSADLLIESNRRDPKVFDLYRYQQANGELRLIAQNPGTVALWLTDAQGQVKGRAAQRDGRWIFETPEALEGPDKSSLQRWRERFRVDLMETVRPLALPLEGDFIWALSDRGRDKLALVRLDFDGREEVVFADARVDVSTVFFSPLRRVPLAVALDPGVQEWHALDASFERTLIQLKTADTVRLTLGSMSDDEKWLVAETTAVSGGAHLLVNAVDHRVELLAQTTRARLASLSALPQPQPVGFHARDGRQVQGYLTKPVASSGQRLPTVLLVHGGPWARDRHLAGDSMVDFLANRGYVVLQVNYRGSTGYGRAFRDAAIGEFAGAMHNDLIDGLDELVRQGIADPQRVAIMGASYGGYASLVGMTFTPERFACGISVVGMSDLERLMEQAPPYWELSLPMWKHFVGDPADPLQREQLRQRSPLFRAAQVRGPVLLLHGAQDPRVKLDQSQRMAQALQEAGKSVELKVFDKAGHGFHRWQDRMRYFRLTEDFLARCLGGRSGGFDFFEVGAWLL